MIHAKPRAGEVLTISFLSARGRRQVVSGEPPEDGGECFLCRSYDDRAKKPCPLPGLAAKTTDGKWKPLPAELGVKAELRRKLYE